MTTDPQAARLYEIVEELGTTNRRIVERDATGSITGLHDRPPNIPRLLAEGNRVLQAAWSHQPASVDAAARLEQLQAMRLFAAAAVDHVRPEAVPLLHERVRQTTNAIRLHYDDDAA